MFEQFTKEEVRILKKICENPIFKESQPLHVEKISSMKKLKFLSKKKIIIFYQKQLQMKKYSYLYRQKMD